MQILQYVLYWMGGASIFAFLLYATDKSRAKRKRHRVRESLLLGVGLCGGALGALIAMNVCRHKTRHWYFWAVNLLALLLHGAVCWMIWKTV